MSKKYFVMLQNSASAHIEFTSFVAAKKYARQLARGVAPAQTEAGWVASIYTIFAGSPPWGLVRYAPGGKAIQYTLPTPDQVKVVITKNYSHHEGTKF